MKIKKEKVVMAITIGIACLTLMLVMFMQFKVVNETDIAQIESMREDELQEAVKEWKEKYEEAYKKFYGKFEEHQTTIAALYAGSVNQDVFMARARGYDSCLHSAVPVTDDTDV